ncbi:MAG: molybdate transport system permease protein [Candidatus Hydrogenedentes bacterium]|nr:molybdate transport system permease protein [Candidatus Hydrogenedentota bacterium]
MRLGSRNRAFTLCMSVVAMFYPVSIAVLIVCCFTYPRGVSPWLPWTEPALRHALMLSLVTSVISAAIALALAIPSGYLLSRYRVPGWRILDLLFYLPIALPPLVMGVALLIFFQTLPGRLIQRYLCEFTFSAPGIVLAQTISSTAFATRICKLAFDNISPKLPGVARTLGATRWQAFLHVELAEARSGLIEAFLLAWTIAFGAFGPIALFCGITRMRTEILSSSVFLEFSVGNLDRALVVSLWMVALAGTALVLVRGRGKRPLW